MQWANPPCFLDLIVDPPTVWNAFMEAFFGGRLTESAIQSFAWLLIEILAPWSVSQLDVLNDARRVDNSGFLLQAASPETRHHGQKLHQIVTVFVPVCGWVSISSFATMYILYN